MIINMTGGGGGTSLNFDVKAYATEELLLAATPKENTIGIITTTAITSWIFSATEPESPVEGMVWITTSTSSTIEFNALKKNAIQVYPVAAKQYVSGAWVDVTAYSYQGGEWVAWWDGVTLYDAGDQALVVTGGWERHADMNFAGSLNSGYVTFNDDSIKITAGSGVASIVSTKNKIDVTGYSAIEFDVLITSVAHNSAYGIISEHGDVYNKYAAARIGDTSAGLRVTLSVDISGVTDGKYYVFVATANNRTRDIYSIKLVR